MEERLLTESGFLEELLVGEEELIDDYVSDDLSLDSRLRFEQHFLCTPDRKQKLRFAFALRRYVSQASEPVAGKSKEDKTEVLPTGLNWGVRFKAFWSGQTLAFRFAMAVAVIAIVVATVWLSRPRPFAPTMFATVTLSISSGDRGGGQTTTKFKLPREVDALKVVLRLPDLSVPARGYRVELINDQGETKALEIAEQEAHSVTVIIPARQLVHGDYALRLYVANSDNTEQRINGNYLFTVE